MTNLTLCPTREATASNTAARTVDRDVAPGEPAPRSFESLLREHEDVAYSVAYRFVGSREAAEDVTQEAFLNAYRARDRFVGGNFRAWLLRIVANAALDELRRRKRRPQQSLDAMHDRTETRPFEPADSGPSPEVLATQHDLRASLERALAGLPDHWRIAVVLSDVHGLSYPEIAEATGVPVGTVKSRLSRARAELRKVLRPDGELRAAPTVAAAQSARHSGRRSFHIQPVS